MHIWAGWFVCVAHLKSKLYRSEFRSSSINTKQRLSFHEPLIKLCLFPSGLIVMVIVPSLPANCPPSASVPPFPARIREDPPFPQAQLMKQHFVTLHNTMDIECIGVYYLRYYSDSVLYSIATSFIFTQSGWLDQSLSLSLSASKILFVMAQRLKYIGLHISSYWLPVTPGHICFFHPSWLSQSSSIICPPRPLQWVHQSSCQEVRHKDPRPVGVSDSETDSFGKPTHPRHPYGLGLR